MRRPAELACLALAATLWAVAAGAAELDFARAWAEPEATRSRLAAAAEDYRRLAGWGGWPRVPEGPKLQAGDEGPRVAALRRRLGLPQLPPLFDAVLEQAVREFQERHGLAVDGVAGVQTMAALNVPAQERLAQIELALERWRRLPLEPGQDFVLVNIPAMQLAAVAGGTPVLEMRVVVGRPDWPTPEFSSTITTVTFSPAWTVPTTIARREVEPRARRDPGYLARSRIEVLDRSGNSFGTDLAAARASGAPYLFRQRPGDDNALGRVRIGAPNRFDVFLHGTPAVSLFAQPARTFSHGCVRLERPLELARWLLADQPRWDEAALAAALARDEPLQTAVTRPVKLHLVYVTAWADSSGSVHFRRDIYGSDAAFRAALAAPGGAGETECTPAPTLEPSRGRG